jgi:GT2 family glycosyltransferase
LDSVFRQSIAEKSFEVIVVDDGSKDKTFKLIEECQEKYNNLRYIRQDNRGMFNAINSAASKAEGEILVTTDSDCILDKDLLRSFNSAFDEKKYIDAFIGKVVRVFKNDFFAPITEYEKEQAFNDKEKDFLHLRLDAKLHTDCFAIKKDIFDKVGGFDENLAKGGADTELGFRILKMGYKVGFLNRAVVYHLERQSIAEIIKRYYNFGNWDTINYKKYFSKSLCLHIQYPINKSWHHSAPFHLYIDIGYFEYITLSLFLVFFMPKLIIALFLIHVIVLTSKTKSIKTSLSVISFRYLNRSAYFFGRFISGIKQKTIYI